MTAASITAENLFGCGKPQIPAGGMESQQQKTLTVHGLGSLDF